MADEADPFLAWLARQPVGAPLSAKEQERLAEAKARIAAGAPRRSTEDLLAAAHALTAPDKPEEGKAKDRSQEHPGSPPEHDDSNPHARYALCQMLDRLGADGVVGWLNSVGVKSLQDELYQHVLWLEEHTRAGERARVAKLLGIDIDAAIAAEEARDPS